jgi:hypothetical protein
VLYQLSYTGPERCIPDHPQNEDHVQSGDRRLPLRPTTHRTLAGLRQRQNAATRPDTLKTAAPARRNCTFIWHRPDAGIVVAKQNWLIGRQPDTPGSRPGIDNDRGATDRACRSFFTPVRISPTTTD